MIVFYSKSNPAPDMLLGKFVFTDGNMYYASLPSPIMVIRETGASLEGQPLSRIMEGDLIIATSVSDDHETKTIRKAAVVCACDTLEEVNAILRANLSAKNLYHASIADGKRLFADLDGQEFNANTAPENRTPKP
jgi:hypothetical protein